MLSFFSKFDANNDGKIDLQEFLVGFSVSTQSSSDEKIRWIFNIYDKNRDGHISKMEMQDILKVRSTIITFFYKNNKKTRLRFAQISRTN